MCTLTQYRKPAPRYGKLQASAWRARGGWFQSDSGDWRRIYVRGNVSRMTKARRAVVYRDAGAWVWRVEEFDLCTHAVRRTANRSLRGTWYVSAAAAMPFADLAARTSD